MTQQGGSHSFSYRGSLCKKVWGFLMRRTCVPLWQFKFTLFPNSDLRCKNVETRPAGARSRLSMEFLANKVASFNHWWNSAVTNSATSNGLRTGQTLWLSENMREQRWQAQGHSKCFTTPIKCKDKWFELRASLTIRLFKKCKRAKSNENYKNYNIRENKRRA